MELDIRDALNRHRRGLDTADKVLDHIEGIIGPDPHPTPIPAPPRVYAGLEAEAQVMRDALTEVAEGARLDDTPDEWATDVLYRAQAAAFLRAHGVGAAKD